MAATQTGAGGQSYPNGSTVAVAYFSDGSVTYTITPAPASSGLSGNNALPPGYPAAFPNATVNPQPQ